jgi:hypothetical protein
MKEMKLQQFNQMCAELKSIENLVSCVQDNTKVCLMPNLHKDMKVYAIDIVVALDNVLKECEKFRKASLNVPIEIE